MRIPLRQLGGPALLAAVGLELLKTLGALSVRRTEANPAYHLVAASVGLLVFLDAVNHMVLFAAALTATSTTGGPATRTAEDIEARHRVEPSLSTCDAVRSGGEDRASLVERQSQTLRATRRLHPQ